MPEFTITNVPVLDRKGRVVGTDVIKRHTSPPSPIQVDDGCVHVICPCGKSYGNVPQAKWDAWALAPKESKGLCGCVSHFS